MSNSNRYYIFIFKIIVCVVDLKLIYTETFSTQVLYFQIYIRFFLLKKNQIFVIFDRKCIPYYFYNRIN